ncbi:MAG: hypothetical protein HYR94_21180 [Chloroflexi bacterium]|nr:hypothetical protein [Chloroflexota bacterium]
MLEIRLDSLRRRGDARLAYDALYSDENISQLDSFYLWVVKLFGLRPEVKFLDVACGKGELAHWAGRTGALGFGSDLSAAAIHQGHCLFPSLPPHQHGSPADSALRGSPGVAGFVRGQRPGGAAHPQI